MHVRACWLVALVFVNAAPAAAPPAREPLPEGARLRLGTARWRFVTRAPSLGPIELSPDRKWLAHSNDDGAVCVYETRTGRCRFRLKREEVSLYPLAFSHDGKQLAAEEQGGGVWILGVSGANESRPLNTQPIFSDTSGFSCAAFLPGDKRLATWNGTHLAIWDVATGKLLRQDRCQSRHHTESFSPDGRLFAFRSDTDALTLMDLVSGRSLRIALPVKKSWPSRWSWSSDGRHMAITTYTREEIRIHETASGKLVRKIPLPECDLSPTAFSPDGRSLAVSVDEGVRIFEVATGKVLAELKMQFPPSKLMYRDTEHLLLIDAGFVWTWNVRSGEQLDGEVGHRADVEGMAFTADSKTLVSVSQDGTLRRWDTRSGRQISVLEDTEAIRGGTLSLSARGGRVVVSGTRFGDCALLDLNKNRIDWHPERKGPFGVVPPGPLLSFDGSLLAAPVYPGVDESDRRVAVELRHAGSGALVRCLNLRQKGVLAFTPDGDWLAASVSRAKTAEVDLFDLQTGKTRQSLKANSVKEESRDCALTVSPDGRLVAAADERGAYVWERASGKLLDRGSLPDKFTCEQIVITPEGRVLVVGWPWQDQYAFLVWDLATRKVLQKSICTSSRDAVALCGNGRTLAVGCDDASILLYDVPQPPARKEARVRVTEGERLWKELAAGDARRAWRAQQRLVDSPAVAIGLLSNHLGTSASTGVVEELAALDSTEYAVREAATQKLAEAVKRNDHTVEFALRDLLRRKPSLEGYLRAERLLEQAGPLVYSAEELRAIRAVAVLEQIGTAEASALLKTLASGGPAVLTHEARAALARLKSR
jgi:WD40 repeat protein